MPHTQAGEYIYMMSKASVCRDETPTSSFSSDSHGRHTICESCAVSVIWTDRSPASHHVICRGIALLLLMQESGLHGHSHSPGSNFKDLSVFFPSLHFSRGLSMEPVWVRCLPYCTGRGQKTACVQQFFSSTMEVPGIKLWLSGLGVC